MPTIYYARQPGGKLEVDITFQSGWKEMTINFEGSSLGVIPTRQELEAGQEFLLPDGRRLAIRLPKRFMALPEVTLAGQRMRAEAQAPRQRIRGAFQAALLIAIVNVVLGSAALLSKAEFVQRLGASYWNLAYGAIFLVLALCVRRGSIVALCGAIVFFVADSLAWFYFLHAQGKQIPALAFVLRAAFLFFMIRGLRGIRQSRAEERDAGERIGGA
jgi:hypothetical protein